jgi:HlyD family secretion protein
LGPGFAVGNGRIEATETDISTKLAGRIDSILVVEGQEVHAGEVVAIMDAQSLRAQLAEAEAQLQHARTAADTANAIVAQRVSEKVTAQAMVVQRQAQMIASQKRFSRTQTLAAEEALSQQQLDDDRATMQSAESAVAATRSQVLSAQAAIDAAKSMVLEALANIAAAQASQVRIAADLEDLSLKAPRDGRIQYRIAEVSEVLPAGGKVLSEVDLTDVYMSFFLPTRDAGRLALGAEARLVFDAAPDFVIPARISFVANVAQFTPKTVETTSEREKLMFRVKARIDPGLLRRYQALVKTGIPGQAYVQLDPSAVWPAVLQIRLPQ